MLFTRDLSHITKCPFHVFRKISIPYSRVSRNLKMDLHECSVPAFSKQIKVLESQHFESPQHNTKRNLGFRERLQIFGVSKKLNNLFLGVMETSKNPEIMNMRGFMLFPKMKAKSYQSQTKQNNSNQLFRYSFNYIYNINGSPDVLNPNQHCSCFFLHFLKVPKFQSFKV